MTSDRAPPLDKTPRCAGRGGLVAIVHESGALSDRLARALCERGHRTRAVTGAAAGDVAGAVARAISEEVPDVIVLDEHMSSASVRAFVAAARASAREKCRATSILALVSESTAALDGVVDAGVDDFARAPFGLAELVARVELRFAAQRASAAAAAAVPAVSDWSERVALTDTATWRDLPSMTRDEIAQMIGLPLVLEPCAGGNASPFVAARIPLTLVAEQLEVVVRIGVDRQTGMRVAEALLGEPTADAAVVADLVKEMANTIAGAAKRAAAPTGVAMTIGLPSLDDGNDRPVLARQQFVCVASSFADDFALIATIEIAECASREVPVHGLREGMVVVRDVVSAGGLMLVAGGTRLTASTAALLQRHLGNKVAVEVSQGVGA